MTGPKFEILKRKGALDRTSDDEPEPKRTSSCTMPIPRHASAHLNEGYLVNVYNEQKRHFSTRATIQRALILPQQVNWSIEVKNYHPVEHSDPLSLKDAPWNDSNTSLEDIDFDDPKRKSQFQSVLWGKYPYDNEPKILPLNPIGRTGICGRGRLGKWGANAAINLITFRIKRNADGHRQYTPKGSPVVEFLMVKRSDCKKWAIPGGFLRDEDWNTDLRCVAIQKTMQETTANRQGAAVSINDVVFNGVSFVDDPRNTDNSWVESRVYAYYLKGNNGEPHANAFANCAISSAKNKNIIKAQWLVYNPSELYFADHESRLIKTIKWLRLVTPKFGCRGCTFPEDLNQEGHYGGCLDDPLQEPIVYPEPDITMSLCDDIIGQDSDESQNSDAGADDITLIGVRHISPSFSPSSKVVPLGNSLIWHLEHETMGELAQIDPADFESLQESGAAREMHASNGYGDAFCLGMTSTEDVQRVAEQHISHVNRTFYITPEAALLMSTAEWEAIFKCTDKINLVLFFNPCFIAPNYSTDDVRYVSQCMKGKEIMKTIVSHHGNKFMLCDHNKHDYAETLTKCHAFVEEIFNNIEVESSKHQELDWETINATVKNTALKHTRVAVSDLACDKVMRDLSEYFYDLYV